MIAAFEASPQFTEDAKKAGLIDKIGYDDDALGAAVSRAGAHAKSVLMNQFLRTKLASKMDGSGPHIALVLAAGMAVLINLLAAHTGADAFARLPGEWPLVGGALTLESLASGGALGLGLVAALLAVAPLSVVLEPHDVVDAVPGPLERTGIAVATSLNLVSGFGRTFTAVSDAQRMRGWRPRGLRSWNEVLVPVFLTVIEDSVLLAEAMEARGFGTGRRTSYASSRWSRWDLAIVCAALGSAALFVGLRVAGATIDWYPYPRPYLPPLSPALVLGCLALSLPAFASAARPRRRG